MQFSELYMAAPETDWQVEADNHVIGPGLALHVRPENTQHFDGRIAVFLYFPIVKSERSSLPPKFRIFVDVTVTTGPTLFDASRIRLEIWEPEEYRQREFVGLRPRRKDVHPLKAYDWCKAREPQPQNPGSTILLTEAACLILQFDVATPEPSREFTLTIEGLQRAGAPLSVPPLHFRPRSLPE